MLMVVFYRIIGLVNKVRNLYLFQLDMHKDEIHLVEQLEQKQLHLIQEIFYQRHQR